MQRRSACQFSQRQRAFVCFESIQYGERAGNSDDAAAQVVLIPAFFQSFIV